MLLLVANGFSLRLSQRLFRAWNIGSLLLLGIIVAIALLSAPSPFQQISRDQPNLAISLFPYTLLPALLVPLVLLSQLLLLSSNHELSNG